MISKILIVSLSIISISTSAQLRLHPIGGGVLLFQNIENSNAEIHNSYRHYRVMPFTGIGLEYGYKKVRCTFNYLPEHLTGYNYYIYGNSGHLFIGNEYPICLKLGYELKKKVSWLRLPKLQYKGNAFVLEDLQSKSNRYLLNFKIIPTIGFRYSRITDKSYQSNNFNLLTDLDQEYSSSGGYDYYIPFKVNNLPIIRRDNNSYLSFGTTFQFFTVKKGRIADRIAIHLEYTKGLFTYLDTQILYRKTGDTQWMSKRLYSRGSNISVTASYPITILNKKGERYRDRHPRQGE